MKFLYTLLLLALISCEPPFLKNTNYPIVLIELDNNKESLDKAHLAKVITRLNDARITSLVLKPIIEEISEADSLLLKALKENLIPTYSSATMLNDQPTFQPNEDSILTKTSILLPRNHRFSKLPHHALKPYFKGVGIENGAFRNSGKLESYYIVGGINGKSFASLALLVTADLFNIDINRLNPKHLRLSKHGSKNIMFSQPNTAYIYLNSSEILSGSFDLKSLQYPIVILYKNKATSEIVSKSGNKLNAEITADMINQLIIEFSAQN